MNDPIDAVITWVDGNDPKHIAKRNKYANEIKAHTHPAANLEGRFVEVNEIKYCIYSIRKFAPWIRNIYLVTDEQCPSWLIESTKNDLNVTIVDHKVIFRDHLNFLPTFNSRSIGSLIWRIPSLSEKFICFNDDVFLINQTEPQDFFDGEYTVIRGHWKTSKDTAIKKLRRVAKIIIKRRKFENLPWTVSNYQREGARVVGFNERFFEMAHAPVCARKSILAEFYRNNNMLLDKNVRYRFRSKNQTSSFVIYTHLALKKGKAEIRDSSDSMLIIPQKGGLKHNRYKFDFIKNENNNVKMLCFQDLYFLKRESPLEFNEVIDFLDKKIMS